MKKLYYLYLLGFIAAITLFASCSNIDDYSYDGPGSESSVNSSFLKDSKGLFEILIAHTPYINHSRSVRAGKVDNLSPGVFAPKWESATVNKKSNLISANVPITTEFKYLAKVEEYKNGKKHIYTLPMPQKLVVVQDIETGRMNCYIMTLIPTSECTNRYKKNLDDMFFNSKVNEKFSGTVIYSSISYNYKIVRADKYVKGRKVKAASMFDGEPYVVFDAKIKNMIGKLRIGRGEAALKTRNGGNEGWEMIGGEWKWVQGSDVINCTSCQPCESHPNILKQCSSHGGNGKCSECNGSCRCITCGCGDGYPCSFEDCTYDLGEVEVLPCNDCKYCEIHQYEIYCEKCAEKNIQIYLGYCPGCQFGPDPGTNPDPGVSGEDGDDEGEQPEECQCSPIKGKKCGCREGGRCKCKEGALYLIVKDKVAVGELVQFEVYPSTATNIKIYTGNNFIFEKELETWGHLSAIAKCPSKWTIFATASGGRLGNLKSDEVSVEVMLPSKKEIHSRADFAEIVSTIWMKTVDALKQGGPDGRLQEFGCWLYYSPSEDKITSGPIQASEPVSFNYETVVSLKPGSRDSNIPGNHFEDGSGRYTVGYVHTHTPLTYVLGSVRRVPGPSPQDLRASQNTKFPAFVYDYLTNEVVTGHQLGGPMVVYAFGAERADADTN